MRTFWIGIVLLAAVGLTVGACSGPATLQTHTPSGPPTVDGTLSEWGGNLTPVGKHEVSMGAIPTDSLLYVAVLIPDPSLIQAVAKRGLVLWVDPAGTQTHGYGVQYPLALQAQRAAQKRIEASGRPGRSSSLDQLFPSDLAVVRSDTIHRRMPARMSSALRVQASLNTGSLIYEAAIPVFSETEGAAETGLQAPLQRPFALGLETPDPDDNEDLFRRTRGIPSVTGRGQRRQRRARQGRRQRSRSRTPSLPTLDAWVEVGRGGS